MSFLDYALPIAALGLGAYGMRQTEGEKAMLANEAKRQGYIEKMLNPPDADVAKREGFVRQAQANQASEILKALRRNVRRGGGRLVDRERIDEMVSRGINTAGPQGRDHVSAMYGKAAGIADLGAGAANLESSRNRGYADLGIKGMSFLDSMRRNGGLTNPFASARAPWLEEDVRGGWDFSPSGPGGTSVHGTS